MSAFSHAMTSLLGRDGFIENEWIGKTLLIAYASVISVGKIRVGDTVRIN